MLTCLILAGPIRLIASDLSIQFNTSQFSYIADTTKKGGWEITIGPKNQPRATALDVRLPVDTVPYR